MILEEIRLGSLTWVILWEYIGPSKISQFSIIFRDKEAATRWAELNSIILI